MKGTNIKCHENSSIGDRVDTCGQTDGQNDEAKGDFQDYANAPTMPPNLTVLSVSLQSNSLLILSGHRSRWIVSYLMTPYHLKRVTCSVIRERL